MQIKSSVLLDDFISGAPKVNCWRYDEGNVIACKAKGEAKTLFHLHTAVPSVALETDGGSFRFPPDMALGACDWCVFTIDGHRGYFVELKGSDFEKSVAQLKSTIGYMSRQYGIIPKKAFSVLSGAHPRNSRPGKANVKLRFRREWPNVELCERSCGNERKSDVVE